MYHTDSYAGLLSIIDELVEVVKAAEAAGIEFFVESVSSNGKSVQAYVPLTPEETSRSSLGRATKRVLYASTLIQAIVMWPRTLAGSSRKILGGSSL